MNKEKHNTTSNGRFEWSYSDERWKHKRESIIKNNPQCYDCPGLSETVHHPVYKKGKAPWEYDNENLVALCWPCHKARHHTENLIMEEILNGSIKMPYPKWVAMMSGLLNGLKMQYEKPTKKTS